jgi:hypothetical protein
MNRLIVILVAFTVGCVTNAQNRQKAVNDFLTEQQLVDYHEYAQFFKMDKDIFLILIEKIDTNRKFGIVGFEPRPEQSYIPNGLLNNYLGIRAAYLIELLLSRDSYNLQEKRRVYGYALIVKDDNYDRLSYQDMVEIKRIYLNWWNENNHKTLQQLRAEWKEGKRPLSGQPYKWI